MDTQSGKDLPENEIKLNPDCELRFEVENSNETVYLEVPDLLFRYVLLTSCEIYDTKIYNSS